MLGHLGINVPDLSVAKRYYDALMPRVGFEPYFDTDEEFSYRPADSKPGTFLFFYLATDPGEYSSQRSGLQHLAFMVRRRSLVHAVHDHIVSSVAPSSTRRKISRSTRGTTTRPFGTTHSASSWKPSVTTTATSAGAVSDWRATSPDRGDPRIGDREAVTRRVGTGDSIGLRCAAEWTDAGGLVVGKGWRALPGVADTGHTGAAGDDSARGQVRGLRRRVGLAIGFVGDAGITFVVDLAADVARWRQEGAHRRRAGRVVRGGMRNSHAAANDDESDCRDDCTLHGVKPSGWAARSAPAKSPGAGSRWSPRRW